jgi:hypothetical protein
VTFFLFFAHQAFPLRGADTWQAAHSSVSTQSRCRFLLVAQVCPTAIPNRPRHPARLLTEASSVAIDVHGSLDRAKDVSSSCGGRVIGAPAGVECVRLAYA